MPTTIIVIAIAAVVALIAWFLLTNNDAEDVSGHSDRPATTTSEELYGKADRPAGPDLEPQDPDALGGDHRPPSTT
ncbi:hypothetical protein [Ilumatobacter sp.]|uniref:hypothetical protein n=1 Tax=Ilumatobacter sp. TaxID=1967498 RepID=UPI003B525832